MTVPTLLFLHHQIIKMENLQTLITVVKRQNERQEVKRHEYF